MQFLQPYHFVSNVKSILQIIAALNIVDENSDNSAPLVT